MYFPERIEKINFIGSKIDTLDKQVYRNLSVIEFLDNKIQGTIAIRLDIIKCQRQAVKKELKNLPWDMERLREDIDKRFEPIRETILLDYSNHLDAAKGSCLDGVANAFDSREKSKLFEAYQEKVDEIVSSVKEELVLDATTDLKVVKHRLKKNFNEQVEEFNTLFDKKTSLTEKSNKLEKELQSECKKLLEEKEDLLRPKVKDIFTACQLGDHNFISREIAKKWFFQKTSFVNQFHDEGYTPLHLACSHNYIECIKIHLVCSHNHLECVKILLRNRAYPMAVDTHGYQPLHWAAKMGNDKEVECLLKDPRKKSFINGRGEYDRTPLHMAVFNRWIDIAALLIKNGADVNAQSNDEEQGVTPLHYAVEQGNLEMVRLLTSFEQLNVNIKNSKGFTPLHYSLIDGNDDIAYLLFDRGADVNAQTSKEGGLLTPLHCAVEKGNLEMVKMLTSYVQLDVNIKNSKGFTPLYEAVVKGEVEIVKRILNHSSFIDSKDPHDPNSILQLFKVIKNSKEEIETLLLLKFEINE